MCRRNSDISEDDIVVIREELSRLQEENQHLKFLLTSHCIPFENVQIASTKPEEITSRLPQVQLSVAEKVSLFRRFFRGRTDTYPRRWESGKGTSGYSPTCGNEWKSGICKKPKVKCSGCVQRHLLPLTDQVIFDHLSGKQTVGVYPLLDDDTCFFLAADFDESDWREDVKAFMRSCHELNIPAALEISRSGNGAHVWIFFAESVPARHARQFGAALISYTCDRTRQLSLASYDRLFPNQDSLPKGGFGNLIALPLQKQPRELGRSVFVDELLVPHQDQWAFLASIQPMTRCSLDATILHASGGRHPLDVAFVTEEESHKPWHRQKSAPSMIAGYMPELLTLVLANQIFIAKADLSQQLANRLIRIAAFQNPEFYKAQAMRLPVWNKPRIIGCAENYSQHLGLPRGCLEAVLSLLQCNDIRHEIQDERLSGLTVNVKFKGKLRKDQAAAVREILKHDFGVLSAPTAFGKTVTSAVIIARRKVSTLILVHRTELMRQWLERLTEFLEVRKGVLGVIGGGKKIPSGFIDIAVMQSLSGLKELGELLDNYGQVIIDECHHLSAFSFEAILKQAKAKYVVGLTATPIRRDGLEPIIFMQCGPIRHVAARPQNFPVKMEVWPKAISAPDIPPNLPIQTVFHKLICDAKRNQLIVNDILSAYQENRKILVLTERAEHLGLLRDMLGNSAINCFVLHGRLGKKQRDSIFAEIESLNGLDPRVILATGRLVGEGFDHPPLDTLVLAMPISWKGTLQQYAGRLHREHSNKNDIRIYDYVEKDQCQLNRMWGKRQRGYHAMGYVIKDWSCSIPMWK